MLSGIVSSMAIEPQGTHRRQKRIMARVANSRVQPLDGPPMVKLGSFDMVHGCKLKYQRSHEKSRIVGVE